MFNQVEVKDWQKDATLVAIVKATFPSFRRKTIYIRARETVTLSGLNWDGGSRSEYRACTLEGVEVGNTARFSQCAPWANPAEGLEVPVPAGMVIVEGGHFCGKESLLRLHVNPADMPKYIKESSNV